MRVGFMQPALIANDRMSDGPCGFFPFNLRRSILHSIVDIILKKKSVLLYDLFDVVL